MKNIKSKSVAVAMCLLTVFCFNACGGNGGSANSNTPSEQPAHVCEYSENWSYDNGGHYKKCESESCDKVIDYNSHYLSDETVDEKGYYYSDCIICGFRKYKTPVEGKFEVLSVDEVVYPYVDFVKTYLTTQDAMVSEYCNSVNQGEAPVIIQWTSDADVDYFKVSYADNESFSGALDFKVDKNERTYNIYNLYSNKQYYVKVEEFLLDGSTKTQNLSFKTADVAARLMHIENIMNVRDLGGYNSLLGGKIKQGNIYRGSAFEDIAYDLSLNEDGKRVLSEEMGIKTEIELRYQFEINSQSGSSATRTQSLISGAAYKLLPIDVYDEVFKTANTTCRQSYLQTFSMLAVESNYPFYIHCQNGADKTGSIAFFINALLGASYEDLRYDYELTSFTKCGLRGADRNQNYSVHFQAIYNGLMAYGSEGDSIAACAEKFLKTVGITDEQISEIRRINLVK